MIGEIGVTLASFHWEKSKSQKFGTEDKSPLLHWGKGRKGLGWGFFCPRERWIKAKIRVRSSWINAYISWKQYSWKRWLLENTNYKVVWMERCHFTYTLPNPVFLPIDRQTATQSSMCLMPACVKAATALPFILPPATNSTLAPYSNVWLMLGKIAVLTKRWKER